jgi:hypothetical protein
MEAVKRLLPRRQIPTKLSQDSHQECSTIGEFLHALPPPQALQVAQFQVTKALPKDASLQLRKPQLWIATPKK